ncbi:hypothetical protein SCLCIDRAFT_1206948, partial [Scleroderma citrinum Foug A]
CTNCANACKRCNEARPCERCVKYGIQESCVDGVRKERQKGIKRGPYKRKNKTTDGEASFEGFTATNGDSEWQGNGASTSNPTSGQSQTPATVHAIPHYPPPEGYFPYFFPPPPGFMAPGHEGAPAPEGASSGTSQPPAMVQYYPMPPPGYYPYPPPGVYPPPQNGSQVPTIDPTDTSRNSSQRVETPKAVPATGKKRSRTGKQAETKTKKAKAAATTTTESSTSGGTVGGNDQGVDGDDN